MDALRGMEMLLNLIPTHWLTPASAPSSRSELVRFMLPLLTASSASSAELITCEVIVTGAAVVGVVVQLAVTVGVALGPGVKEGVGVAVRVEVGVCVEVGVSVLVRVSVGVVLVAYTITSFGAAAISPLYASAVRLPVPLTMITTELPDTQADRLTIS